MPKLHPAFASSLLTIATAVDLFRDTSTHDLASAYRAAHCCATSTHGDTIAITWHLLYHTGRAPFAVRPGRGHSYRVIMFRGDDDLTARVNDPNDHRNGIAFTPAILSREGSYGAA